MDDRQRRQVVAQLERLAHERRGLEASYQQASEIYARKLAYLGKRAERNTAAMAELAAWLERQHPTEDDPMSIFTGPIVVADEDDGPRREEGK